MANALNPKKLSQRLESKLDASPEEIQEMTEKLFDILKRELKTTDRVAIHPFGTFKKIYVPQSAGRNPHTGETITIEAHYRVKFSPKKAVADRINKQYAHLKPVILEDDTVIEEEIEVTVVETPPEPTIEAKPEITEKEEPKTEFFSNKEEETMVSEELLGSTTEENKKRKPLLLGLIILLLLLLGYFLLSPSDKKTTQTVKTVQSEPEVEPVIMSEPVVETEFEVTPEPEPVAEPMIEAKIIAKPMENHTIVGGDSFSLLAKSEWGDMDLWPYIYQANREGHPDPDKLALGDSILVPYKPDLTKDRTVIEEAILQTYIRYLELMGTDRYSSINKIRLLSSRYVILGGAKLYPTFLEENESRLKEDDLKFLTEKLSQE